MLSMASSPGRGYKNPIFNEKISSAKSEPDLTKNPERSCLLASHFCIGNTLFIYFFFFFSGRGLRGYLVFSILGVKRGIGYDGV